MRIEEWPSESLFTTKSQDYIYISKDLVLHIKNDITICENYFIENLFKKIILKLIGSARVINRYLLLFH